MAATSELRVGLARHSFTELAGAASPGTHLLFSNLERGLGARCSLRLLPPYYYNVEPHGAVEIARDLLSQVDALVLSLPPNPVDLEALFLTRRAMNRRIPFIYLPLGEFPRGAWCYRQLYRHLQAGDLILFSSHADRAVYDALVASSPARVTVQPFGFDVAAFRVAATAREATRRHLGIGPKEVVFVVHGRLEPEKNVHGAAAMFRNLARRLPSCRLWLVGPVPGALRWIPGPRAISELTGSDYLDVLSRSLGDDGSERTWFWGAVPYGFVPHILAAADIGVNLTLNRDENFGYSTVEAMAAGLPVIGTDWGGVRDTIDDGVTGYRVPTVMTEAGVAADLWEAEQRAVDLACDPVSRHRMATAGVARASDHYALDRWADRLVEEIEDLLRFPGPPRPHRWTPLGDQLEERYSMGLAGQLAPSFPLPLPSSRSLLRDPLVRAVLLPYATREQDDDPDAGAVLVPASPLLRLDGQTFTSDDPIYPLRTAAATPTERLVFALLEGGPLTYEQVMSSATPAASPAEVFRAVRRLLAAGIVLQSRYPSRTAAPRIVQQSQCPSRTAAAGIVLQSQCPSRTATAGIVLQSSCPSGTAAPGAEDVDEHERLRCGVGARDSR